MARKGISYQQVAGVCENLKNEGQRLSVRAIHAQTGGSLSTVLKHYRTWQEEQEPGVQFKGGISRQLQKALLAELELTAVRARETNAARLAAAELRIADLESRLGQTETALQQARSKLAEMENRPPAAEGSLWDQEAASPAPRGPAKQRKKPAADRKPGKSSGEGEPQLFDF